MLVTNGHTPTVIEWDGKMSTASVIRQTFTVETAPELVGNLFHVVKASPQCSGTFGTFRADVCADVPEPAGCLYSYDTCYGVKTLISNRKVSGGIDWNAGENKFYYIRSCDNTVKEYDYDKKTRDICKYRVGI